MFFIIKSYQEWWRDWPVETQQPVNSDKLQVISDKLLILVCHLCRFVTYYLVVRGRLFHSFKLIDKGIFIGRVILT